MDPSRPATAAGLTVITLEAIFGIFINLFILVVIGLDWNTERSLSSGDALRAAMSRSSIVLTLVLISSFYWYFFFTNIYAALNVIYNLLIMYSISSSLYLTALFCFFLFIKIVQFQSGVIVWLKRKVHVVSRLAVGVEIFCFFTSFLNFLFSGVNEEVYTNSSIVSASNVNNGKGLDLQVSFLILVVLLVPYILMAMTTITAAGSLLLHGQKMKNMKNNGAVNTETYKSTACKMMAFFMSHTLFCFVLSLSYFSQIVGHSRWFWIVGIILFLLPAANSLILIYSNTRLRETWKRMIVWIFCCSSSVQLIK